MLQGKTSPSRSGRVYVNRAQDVVSNMLAKGSAIRQDAINKAKAFDEKHHLTANASARVISFDKRVGLSQKLNVGISAVNEKVKSVDQRLQVSDKTMAAIMAAERKLNDTGSAVKSSRLLKNLYQFVFLFSFIRCLTWRHAAFSIFLLFSILLVPSSISFCDRENMQSYKSITASE